MATTVYMPVPETKETVTENRWNYQRFKSFAC